MSKSLFQKKFSVIILISILCSVSNLFCLINDNLNQL